MCIISCTSLVNKLCSVEDRVCEVEVPRLEHYEFLKYDIGVYNVELRVYFKLIATVPQYFIFGNKFVNFILVKINIEV